RALKRAALPVAYSEGFTRHPQIALAAPLPVGATGEGELMDVFLEETVEPAAFAARLAAQAPPGLDVRDVVEVPLAWPSLQSLVREGAWRAPLPPGAGGPPPRPPGGGLPGGEGIPRGAAPGEPGARAPARARGPG